MESDGSILEGLDALPARLDALGARRVLVITTPARRFLDRLPLDGRTVQVFDGARVHVPREAVEAASRALRESEADTVIALGGGSATGLGKALRLAHDVRFVAVPTTYAGSEMTRIYGITDAGAKETGRDERVRPDLVVHEPSLFRGLPKRLTATSLMNAMAHPLGALSTGGLDEAGRGRALRAVRTLGWALDHLLQARESPEGRRAALRGTALAGAVLDGAELGAHHRVAHRLGGRFGLDHAGLHAVLLPHSVRRLAELDRALHDAVAEALGRPDPSAALYDALTRAGAARSLVDLGLAHEDFEAFAADEPALRELWVEDARLGRRPSIRQRTWDAGERPPTTVVGPAPSEAARVVVALHGRGANAGRMARDVLDLVGHDPDTLVVAPQAPRNAWYAASYRAPLAELGAPLEASLAAVDAVLARVLADVPPERVFLAGFSQGACLACEVFARSDAKLGGLVALAGARIGPPGEQPPVARDRAGARALLGVSEGDRWVRAGDVESTADALRAAGAEVTVQGSPGEAHEMSARQRILARELLLGRSVRDGQRGFGNAHETEALPGALPRHQNSPRRAPYGLYPEQINGTGFLAERRENRRAWLYRIRPSAQHTPFSPLPHPTLLDDWDEAPLDPNLTGFRPLPRPREPTDFVDGLATVGGAGHPRLRRGYAIHLYAANRSMEHRAFYDADGELLVVPQEGALTLLTEQGVLDVAPGHVAVVPRGTKLSVLLPDGFARGYVGEVYGRRFELPDRGPLGSNGLTDPRHFVAPRAFFEDRVDPGFRITAKLGNRLFEATQDHSPFDVVAWHGDHAPHAYDLADFCPAGNTRFDHPDPSVYVVIGAPLDERGADSLDFVFFPPRWDVSEHTFRPPFFHRNAVTEFNGIIADPSLGPDGPFEPGCAFLTPSMTPHGVLARAVEAALRKRDAVADRPARTGDGSKWFQLESTLPLGLTSWARETPHRIRDWPLVWGTYRAHFDPEAG